MRGLHVSHLDAYRVAYPNAPEACARVLFLGEDNPQSAAPQHALYPLPAGCAGNRFCNDILAVRASTYLATWRTNLCNPAWLTKNARERAVDLIKHDVPWDVIVLLGAKVRKVFEPMGAKDTFAYREVRLQLGDSPTESKVFRLVSLPHPSGRNLVWNDRRMALKARELLREVAPDYPWGEALVEDSILQAGAR